MKNQLSIKIQRTFFTSSRYNKFYVWLVTSACDIEIIKVYNRALDIYIIAIDNRYFNDSIMQEQKAGN